MFFEERSYLGGSITKKFCTNCPTNCETCNDNNECLTCTSTTYANFDAATSRCNCIVPNCRNCTLSECEICDGTMFKHIDALNDITCQEGFEGNSGCIEGYGRILGEVVTPTYTPSCVPCSLLNCRFCAADNNVCTACFDPMEIRFNGECGILPKCRSPEILRYETEICRDCSGDFEAIEAV